MPIIQTDKQLRKRDPRDWYPTPRGLVKSVLSPGISHLRHVYGAARILDAGAGLGPWGRQARELWPRSYIEGIDLHFRWHHPDYNAWAVGDFLNNHYEDGEFHLVMGNPPYFMAEEFVREGVRVSQGWVVYLLRLGFLESQKRMSGLYTEIRPEYIYVLGKRPSFTGDGKTDATAYAVFYFNVNNLYAYPTIRWLDWDYLPTDRWAHHFQVDLTTLSPEMIGHLMRTHGVV